MFQVSCQGGFEDNCVSGDIFKQRRSEGSADETCRIPSMDPVLADLLNLRFFSSVYHLSTISPQCPFFFNEIHPSQHFLASQRVFLSSIDFYIEFQGKSPEVPVNLCSGRFCPLSWVNQERFVEISGTIWETGSSVHPDQHELLEAESDHRSPIPKPQTGAIIGPAEIPPHIHAAIKLRMCFGSNHSLVSDSGGHSLDPGVIMVVTI